jgi:hypothetical protein
VSTEQDIEPALSSAETKVFLTDLEEVQSRWKDAVELTKMFRQDQVDHIKKIQEVISKISHL